MFSKSMEPNPFTTRLDHIFAAIGDLHEAIDIDGRDIAGREPSLPFVIELQRTIPFVPEVVAHHPWPAHQQVTRSRAVPGQLDAVSANDLHVDAKHCTALFGLHGITLFRAHLNVLGFHGADGPNRAQLSHPPGVQYRYAVGFLELAQHGSGGRPRHQ